MTSEEIQKKLDEFISINNGKPLEVEDPSNRDQCFDLALGWCDALGIPRETIRHLNASEIWTDPTDLAVQYFDFIPNTPNGIPQKGDIVVFSGKVGHVSVATGKGDSNTFESWDENWDTAHFNAGIDPKTGLLIPICRFLTHQYNDVLGWLHPKSVVPPQPEPINDQTKYDFGGDTGNVELGAMRSMYNDARRNLVNAEVANKQQADIIGLLQGDVTQANNTITELNTQIDNLKKENQDQVEIIDQLRKQIQDTPTNPNLPPVTPPDTSTAGVASYSKILSFPPPFGGSLYYGKNE